jgi:hypothetical protein
MRECHMKNFNKLLLVLMVLLLLPITAFAAPVGKITHVEGRVDITAAWPSSASR